MRVLINALFTVPNVQTGAVQTVTEALFGQMAAASGEMGIELAILVSETNAEHWAGQLPGVEQARVPFQTGNQFVRIGFEQGAAHWAAKKVGADIYYSTSGALPLAPLPCKSAV